MPVFHSHFNHNSLEVLHRSCDHENTYDGVIEVTKWTKNDLGTDIDWGDNVDDDIYYPPKQGPFETPWKMAKIA